MAIDSSYILLRVLKRIYIVFQSGIWLVSKHPLYEIFQCNKRINSITHKVIAKT